MQANKKITCPVCGGKGIAGTHGLGWCFVCLDCPVTYGVGSIDSIKLSGDTFTMVYHGLFKSFKDCKRAVNETFGG